MESPAAHHAAMDGYAVCAAQTFGAREGKALALTLGTKAFAVNTGNVLPSGCDAVIMIEHDMHVASNSDWIIDMGPGAGDEGGLIVAEGTPKEVAKSKDSRTAPFLLT